MLYSLFTLLSLICFTFSLQRDFKPDTPEKLKWNNKKVWLWLNRECFSSESDVLSFKDELLSNYDCLSYNSKRHNKIFYCGENDSQWSLWMDLDVDNVQCLNKEITISNIEDTCVTRVVYEPLQHMTGPYDGKLKEVTSNLVTRLKGNYINMNGFTKLKDQIKDHFLKEQPTCYGQDTWAGYSATQLRTLDYMDGTIDGEYRTNADSNNNIGAIILDGPVDLDHIEFLGSETTMLNDFDTSRCSQCDFDHGTHVCGTVCGQNMGNAKGNTPIWNYPACQLGNSCAWSDIETGYNAAISLMSSVSNMRFVINYSVGGSKSALTTPQYDSWGNQINNNGGMWVTSAGNSASDACNFSPAYNTMAITVGSMSISATTGALTPTTWFTNYGTCVDVWSGGENVISSYPGNEYGSMSGTSMASPQICGLVINLLRDDQSLTRTQVINSLRANSNPINANSNTAPNNYAPYYNGCN